MWGLRKAFWSRNVHLTLASYDSSKGWLYSILYFGSGWITSLQFTVDIELRSNGFYSRSANSQKKQIRTQRPVFLKLQTFLFTSLITIRESLVCPANKSPKECSPPVVTDRKSRPKLLYQVLRVWFFHIIRVH